jgi:beta-lactamase regulating signal transducer with metallopeptidase domain
VLENWLSPALVRALGYALLHSLWQGAALAGLLAAALPLLRRHRPEVRYAASAAAVAGLVLAVAGTFGYYYSQSTPAPLAAAPLAHSLREQVVIERILAMQAHTPAPTTDLLPLLARWAEPYLPVLVAAWLLGLLLMAGRLAGGLYYTGRLRRAGTQALGAEWQQRLSALAARAGLRRPVALLESGRVRGPLVLGYLRPAILLPLGAVAGLPPALLEALLAHELAHIVRRDYLLNLALAATEALFFYHPAVWFMAGCLRAERENCCDDQAAALCGGDALRVARALAALAELEASATPAPRLALAAAGVGGRGSLLARVRRLALGRPQAPTLTEGLLASGLCLLGVAGLGTGLAMAAPLTKSAARLPWQTVPADTTRRLAPAAPAPPAVPLPPAAASVPAAPLAPLAVPPVPPAAPVPGSWATAGPPRRPARRIVLEKDKKGRVVSMTVDGQPVATGETGKKAKHGKTTSTVEIIEPSAGSAGWSDIRILNRGWSSVQPLSRGWDDVRLRNRGWSSGPARAQAGWGTVDLRGLTVNPDFFRFRLSPDEQDPKQEKALAKARAGLAKSLRNPALTDEQRRAIERAQRSLDEGNGALAPRTYRLDERTRGLKRITPERQELHIELDGQALQRNLTLSLPGLLNSQQDLASAQRDMAQHQRAMQQYERDMQAYQREMRQYERAMQADQRQAEADMRQAESDARQAQADARSIFGQGGPSTSAASRAARRAQLEARIAAAKAELQALDGGNAASRGRVTFPPPARLPRVPQAPAMPVLPLGPQGAVGPALPAPPAPPTGPTTQELREELRRDGLLGKDERSFTFQLNEKELRVNGQVLSAAQAEKYRRLYQLPASSQGKGRRTVNISINEN